MKIKGTFIQSGYCGKFSNARWDEEFEVMKRCGMDMLILADHKFDLEYVRRVLQAAKRNGATLCLGTGEFPQWWKRGGQKEEIVTYFTETAAQTRDLFSRLTISEKETLFGWYFVPEISSAYTLGYSPYLVKAMNILIAELEKTDPKLPLLLSPYYTEYMAKSINKCKQDWVRILQEVNFRKQDILCPQDAIGATWTRPETLPAAMKMYQDAIKESGKEIQFWLNVEDFCQSNDGKKLFMPERSENRCFIPCSIRRFAWQLEHALQYTDTLVTFAYNHYHSPLIVHPDFDKALRIYLETGELKENDFKMSPGQIVKEQGKTYFVYEEIESDWAVQCVRAYRLDIKGHRHFAGRCDRPHSPKDPLADRLLMEDTHKGSYIAIAEDVWGNESVPYSFNI